MNTVMNHNFSMVPRANMERSVFDRSHGHKSTFKVGYLVPFYRDEVLPGDTFNLRATIFARLSSPLKFPIMDNLFIDTFYFFVPRRLVWEHWQQFCGERDTLAEIMTPTDYLIPVLGVDGEPPEQSTVVVEGSLSDHLGLPLTVEGGRQLLINIDAAYHRAYNLIINEWFRDQNLQEKLTIDRSDGPDLTEYEIVKRCKKHDYFTSALPWPQKGPAIELPLGVSAPVHGNEYAVKLVDSTNYFALGGKPNEIIMKVSDGNPMAMNADISGLTNATSTNRALGFPSSPILTGLETDLSSATAATINNLREAFQLQKMLERDARGGTRYIEIVRSHFNVINPDYRLQRPEYLGGSSDRMHVNPVQQTSESTSASKQGTLTAYATSVANGGFSKSFTEHGVIIGLVNVRADITYSQGIPRDFMRRTRYDFYWPALAHLGEQEIYRGEIYATGGGTQIDPEDWDTWAYQERFAEYRYKPSQITGLFRPEAVLSLDAWHLSEELSAVPPVNASWIVDATPIERVLAVTSEDHVIFDSFIQLKTARCMPVYSVPGLIDHF